MPARKRALIRLGQSPTSKGSLKKALSKKPKENTSDVQPPTIQTTAVVFPSGNPVPTSHRRGVSSERASDMSTVDGVNFATRSKPIRSMSVRACVRDDVRGLAFEVHSPRHVRVTYMYYYNGVPLVHTVGRDSIRLAYIPRFSFSSTRRIGFVAGCFGRSIGITCSG